MEPCLKKSKWKVLMIPAKKISWEIFCGLVIVRKRESSVELNEEGSVGSAWRRAWLGFLIGGFGWPQHFSPLSKPRLGLFPFPSSIFLLFPLPSWPRMVRWRFGWAVWPRLDLPPFISCTIPFLVAYANIHVLGFHIMFFFFLISWPIPFDVVNFQSIYDFLVL